MLGHFDPKMAEDYSRFDDSFDSEDVDFSSVLKAVLKSADTQADHWLQADAVQAINECIKGKRTSLVETLWKRISIEGESPSEDTYRCMYLSFGRGAAFPYCVRVTRCTLGSYFFFC